MTNLDYLMTKYIHFYIIEKNIFYLIAKFYTREISLQIIKFNTHKIQYFAEKENLI